MKIIAGNKLKKNWDLDGDTLAYIALKHELKVLDFNWKTGLVKALFNPLGLELESERILEIIQNDFEELSKKHFWLPQIESLEKEGIFELYKQKFRKSDLISSQVRISEQNTTSVQSDNIDIELDLDLGMPEENQLDSVKENQAGALKNVIEKHDDEIKDNDNVFSLLGKCWFVKYQKTSWGIYPDLEKYRYVANLLSLTAIAKDRLDLKFTVRNLNLYRNIKKIPNDGCTETDFREQIDKHGIKVLRNAVEKIIEELKIAMIHGQPDKTIKAKQNLTKLKKLLLDEYGVVVKHDENFENIKLRQAYVRTRPENEKIRQVIKNQLKNAIIDFKERMPSLSSHLKKSIRTKTYETCYEPDQEILWHVSR